MLNELRRTSISWNLLIPLGGMSMASREYLIMYIDLELERPYDFVFNSLVVTIHCFSNINVLLLLTVIDWYI